MTAAVLDRPTAAAQAALPAIPASHPGPEQRPRVTAAVEYERLLHRALRRELHLLAEVTGWADPEDRTRARQLTRHADLIARLGLHHHAVEREHLWPALFPHLPRHERPAARTAIIEWTSRAAVLDHELRDLSTVARQWAVVPTRPARSAFQRALTRLAGAVGAHTDAEARDLLPRLGRHLPDAEWAVISRTARPPFDATEQLFLLGLLLEDATADQRARIGAALDPVTGLAWRVAGRRRYRAAIVRLRGAPPAA